MDPASMKVEDVAAWIVEVERRWRYHGNVDIARAVRALVEKYVTRAVHEATETPMREDDLIGNANRQARWEQHTSAIVSRVMEDSK